jgi:hypothetical protein
MTQQTPARITDPWGERTPYGRGQQWPVRVDAQLADGVQERDVERYREQACDSRTAAPAALAEAPG